MGIKCSAKQGARNPAHFPLKKRNRDRPSLRIHRRPEARRPRDGLQLTRLIDIQLSDNQKARSIAPDGSNPYLRNDEKPLRSQAAFRDFLAAL